MRHTHDLAAVKAYIGQFIRNHAPLDRARLFMCHQRWMPTSLSIELIGAEAAVFRRSREEEKIKSSYIKISALPPKAEIGEHHRQRQ
jgi:hypothetical protein